MYAPRRAAFVPSELRRIWKRPDLLGDVKTLKRCETGLNCAHTALKGVYASREGVYAVHARLVQNEWNIYRLLEVTDNSYGDGNGAAFRTR